MKAPFAYYGGKMGLASEIVSLLPDHDVYLVHDGCPVETRRVVNLFAGPGGWDVAALQLGLALEVVA